MSSRNRLDAVTELLTFSGLCDEDQELPIRLGASEPAVSIPAYEVAQHILDAADTAADLGPDPPTLADTAEAVRLALVDLGVTPADAVDPSGRTLRQVNAIPARLGISRCRMSAALELLADAAESYQQADVP